MPRPLCAETVTSAPASGRPLVVHDLPQDLGGPGQLDLQAAGDVGAQLDLGRGGHGVTGQPRPGLVAAGRDRRDGELALAVAADDLEGVAGGGGDQLDLDPGQRAALVVDHAAVESGTRPHRQLGRRQPAGVLVDLHRLVLRDLRPGRRAQHEPAEPQPVEQEQALVVGERLARGGQRRPAQQHPGLDHRAAVGAHHHAAQAAGLALEAQHQRAGRDVHAFQAQRSEAGGLHHDRPGSRRQPGQGELAVRTALGLQHAGAGGTAAQRPGEQRRLAQRAALGVLDDALQQLHRVQTQHGGQRLPAGQLHRHPGGREAGQLAPQHVASGRDVGDGEGAVGCRLTFPHDCRRSSRESGRAGTPRPGSGRWR